MVEKEAGPAVANDQSSTEASKKTHQQGPGSQGSRNTCMCSEHGTCGKDMGALHHPDTSPHSLLYLPIPEWQLLHYNSVSMALPEFSACFLKYQIQKSHENL